MLKIQIKWKSYKMLRKTELWKANECTWCKQSVYNTWHGLAYLNKKSITHRNLSKSNILFDIKVKVLFFFSSAGPNVHVMYCKHFENNHFKLFFPKSFILCPSIKAILDFRSTKINTIFIEGHKRNIPNSNNLRTNVHFIWIFNMAAS
jgi:serine/threonine protein kinase